MTAIYWQIAADLGGACAAGGVIGFERSYHGRAAGFRTHSLVGLASAAAVMTAYAPLVTKGLFPPGLALDPSRVAQGVMTGVGFLGAGVIFKEGVNVQGLTTAASIWATAALGILFRLGEWWPGFLASVAVLATLIVLRWVEARLTSRVYAWAIFRFRASDPLGEEDLRAFLASKGVTLHEVSYAKSHDGALIEFSGDLKAETEAGFRDLAAHLRTLDGLAEYELSRVSK